MANLTVTNVDLGALVLFDPRYDDDVFTGAASTTYLEGTLLARDSSTLKLIPYVKGGTTNGNGIPVAILTPELVTDGAGDYPLRPLLKGEVRADKLIIAADGDNSNVDAGVLDLLRDFGIFAKGNTDLTVLDNQ